MKIYDGGSLIIEDDKIIQKFGIDSPAVEKLIAYCHKEKIPVRYSTYDKDCLAESCDASVFDKFFKLYLNYPLVKHMSRRKFSICWHILIKRIRLNS